MISRSIVLLAVVACLAGLYLADDIKFDKCETEECNFAKKLSLDHKKEAESQISKKLEKWEPCSYQKLSMEKGDKYQIHVDVCKDHKLVMVLCVKPDKKSTLKGAVLLPKGDDKKDERDKLMKELETKLLKKEKEEEHSTTHKPSEAPAKKDSETHSTHKPSEAPAKKDSETHSTHKPSEAPSTTAKPSTTKKAT